MVKPALKITVEERQTVNGDDKKLSKHRHHRHPKDGESKGSKHKHSSKHTHDKRGSDKRVADLLIVNAELREELARRQGIITSLATENSALKIDHSAQERKKKKALERAEQAEDDNQIFISRLAEQALQSREAERKLEESYQEQLAESYAEQEILLTKLEKAGKENEDLREQAADCDFLEDRNVILARENEGLAEEVERLGAEKEAWRQQCATLVEEKLAAEQQLAAVQAEEEFQQESAPEHPDRVKADPVGDLVREETVRMGCNANIAGWLEWERTQQEQFQEFQKFEQHWPHYNQLSVSGKFSEYKVWGRSHLDPVRVDPEQDRAKEKAFRETITSKAPALATWQDRVDGEKWAIGEYPYTQEEKPHYVYAARNTFSTTVPYSPQGTPEREDRDVDRRREEKVLKEYGQWRDSIRSTVENGKLKTHVVCRG